MQILPYFLFLLAGAACTYIIFKMRINKISSDLNLKIEEIREIKKEKPIAVISKSDDGESIKQTEDLKNRYDNLQIVNELGQRVTSSLNLEETFQHLYKTVNSIMDAAVFELGVYYRRENRWKILSNIEIKTNEKDPELNYKNHMAEWCLHNNREIFLNDAENEFSRYVFKPLILSNGKMSQSVMSFPIFNKDQECGSLTVISFRKNAFNEYHVEMLRSLLPYTAVAVENALVHQELISTQDQLIQNEKMASIGQLVSGIAHEILNPLNFVNNFSKLSIDLIEEIQPTLPAEEQIELKSQLVNNLDKISFHGSRAYDIVKSMMLLSRSGKGEKDAVEINKSIQEFLTISYQGFKLKSKDFECKLELMLDENLPVTELIAQDFGRVLINLFNNSFYAVNDKRKKLNSLSQQSTTALYEPVLTIKTSVVNSRIAVTVHDNGTGIPEEIREKVFLPFFTTKPPGEGTGLGLSLSHDIIIKGNRGELNFKSELGKWTEFRIELPVVHPHQSN